MSDEKKTAPQQQNHGNSGQRLNGSFTIEFDDGFGRYITVHALKKRYRGAWSVAQMASRKDPVSGKRIGARDLGDAMANSPDV